MKLLSCYIENYGNLSRWECSFKDGITEFCRENGYGKTTLASFIKAMLYGLPSVRKGGRFNDRQHFYPFGGGKFGGSLVLKKDEKEYKIERFFDKTSETRDSLVIYCNGSLLKEAGGREPGELFFGLDGAAFERTAFLGAQDVEIGATESISARLGRTVDNADEDGNYEKAHKMLDEARKRLCPDRGGKGRIREKEEEIRAIQEQVENLRRTEAALEQNYEEANRQKREIRELEDADAQANAQALLLQKWETYDGLCEALKEAREKAEAIDERYACGLPSPEEIEEMRRGREEMISIRAKREARGLNEEEEAQLEAFARRFAKGVPSERELEMANGCAGEFRRLTTEMEGMRAGASRQPGRELLERFRAGVPTKEEREALRTLAERYKDVQEEMKTRTGEALSAEMHKSENGKGRGPTWAVAGMTAVAAGLAAAVAGLYRTTGLAFFVFGELLAAGLAAVIFFSRRGGLRTERPAGDGKAILAMQGEMERIEGEVCERLLPYGGASGNGVKFDCAALEKDLTAYEDFCAMSARVQETLREKEEACRARMEEMTAFLERYALPGECPDGLRTLQLSGGAQGGAEALGDVFAALRLDIEAYRRLEKAAKEAEAERRRCDGRQAEILGRLGEILSGYGMEADENLAGQLDVLARDEAEKRRLNADILQRREKMEASQAQHGLLQRPQESLPDLEVRQKELSDRRGRYAALERRIAEAERELERMPELETRLDRAQEALQAYKTRHGIYEAALAALETAQQNLKDRYILPVREKFCFYAAALEEALGEKIVMDKDFHIAFERGGENRGDGHLSAGQRSLCALCFRLALIENMYDKEKPFIVMDDPFVHLDEKHMERARGMMKKLAQAGQMIYFCCHDSRSLG